MAEQDPQKGKPRRGTDAGSATRPAQGSRRSYDDILRKLSDLRKNQTDLQQQRVGLRNRRRQIVEEELQEFGWAVDSLEATKRIIDVELESTEEEISRLDKAIERESHAVERLEDLRLKAQDEGRKLGYDWFKHLTTLGTGSIVVLGALLNNLLSGALQWTGLLPVVFGTLFVSVVGALIIMYLINMVVLTSSSVGQGEEEYLASQGRLRRYLTYAMWPTLTLFAVGILCLILFVLRNLLCTA